MTARGRSREIAKRLLLLAVSCLLAFALAEIVVLIVFGEQPKFPRHVVEAPWKLRYNQPLARYRQKSADVTVSFRINAQGMRADQDVSYEKPAGVKRVVSLGDSYTVGYEVDVEESFSSVLEQDLEDGGQRVQVLNAGVSGFSNAEELLYFERELVKYEPDLVVLTFSPNDLLDNVRTNLFTLDDSGRLVQARDRYVPGGRLGNFLNRNWFVNLLSERSNAFVFLKERLTHLVKRRMVEENEASLELARKKASGGPSEEPLAATYNQKLAGAILERLYANTRELGIPLIIQTVPSRGGGSRDLVEPFPVDAFDLDRPGVFFLPGKMVLDPHVGESDLYHERSHFHWTPFAHRKSGEALARLIRTEALLP